MNLMTCGVSIGSLIENPTYGDWEGSLYKFNFDRSNEEIIQIRNKKLDEAK